MRRVHLLPQGCALLVACGFLLNCGGTPIVQAPVGTPISGVIDTGTFRIPAGETRTVTGPLVVRATELVDIQGTLVIPDGVEVAISSDKEFVMAGEVRSDATRAPAGPDPTPPIILRGAPVRITGNYRGNSSGIDIVASSEDGEVVVGGQLSMPDGKNGADGSPATKGGNAPPISLDSTAAARGKAKLGKDCFPVKSLVVNGSIRLGNGGNGGNDLTGHDAEGEKVGQSGDGGDGGNLRADPALQGAVQVNGTIIMGDGGNGGNCGSPNAPLAGADGVSRFQEGQSVSIITGQGGAPGFPSIQITGAGFAAGKFGVAGSAYAHAGNGGPNAFGGKTSVLVRNSGVPPHKLPLPEVVLTGGGNGGDSDNPGSKGGVGGGVAIFGGKLVTGSTTKYFKADVSRILIVDYGRGGKGFDGCKVNPMTNGTDGGFGANLLVVGVPYTIQGNSFSGGDGLDGIQPGKGGLGGSDDSPQKIGHDGKDGAPCGGTITRIAAVTDWLNRVDLIRIEDTFWLGEYPNGRAVGVLKRPCGITYHSSTGNYIVADKDENSIEWFKDTTTTGAGEFGTLGAGTGNFNGPQDVCSDSSGRLYIADTNNNRIVRINDLSGSGWTTYQPTGLQALNHPVGVTVGSNGAIYICDTGNNRIVKIDDLSGAGWAAFGTLGNGTLQFSGPSKIALDSMSRIYVADRDNHRIVRINDITGAGWDSVGSLGSSIGKFNTPQYVAIDALQQLWIVDSNNHRFVRLDGLSISNWFQYGTLGTNIAQFIAPYGVAIKE